MSHLKLTLTVDAADAATLEAALLAAGAESISCFDAADVPILEPAPGATPLWPSVRLEALFPEGADAGSIDAALGQELSTVPPHCYSVLADRVWEREWLKDFHCMRFGRRLWVCPGGERPSEVDAVRVELDPGLAFGTGTHATTALCLEWLDAARLTGRTVLDFGCGSGILAIAALRLGAVHAVACDIDPQALLATRANAEKNAVAERLLVAAPGELPEGQFDVLLANILEGPILAALPEFARRVVRGGAIVLTGLLKTQAATVATAALPWFDIEAPAIRDGWALLGGIRNAGPAPTRYEAC